MEACVQEVMKAAGRLSHEAAQQLLDRLDRQAERIVRERGLSPADALQAASKEAIGQLDAAAAIARRNQLLNLQKRIARRDRIEDLAVTLGGKKGPDLYEALRAQVVAIFTPVQGGRMSAEAVWKTRTKEYVDALVVDLKHAGLLKAVRNGTLETEWAKELFELSRKAASDPAANPGITKSAEALKIAETIHKYQSLAKQRLNREGAWIGDYSGYITRTAHDADEIRRAGFDAWSKLIGPRLDDRTFPDLAPAARAKFLKAVWHDLITGVHMSDAGPVGMKDPAFTGPANLAAKASAERVLHFKNAQGWLDYQRKFGTGTLIEQVMGGLNRAARQEAMMQRWGTNPRAEFEQDVRALEEKFHDKAPDAVVALRAKTSALTSLFDRLDGTATRPGSAMGAQIASDLRTIESMAKLGMVAFTHLSAGVTKAAELRYQGVGLLDRYANFLESIVQGRGRSEMRTLADLLQAGTEGMHGNILSRFQPDDTVPGTLSKLANRFFELSGLTWLLDAQKTGAMRIMARHLGTLVGTPHDDLPPEVQRGLLQYDISPSEWEALRTAPNHFTTADGRTFLVPEAAQRATEASLRAHLGAGRLNPKATPAQVANLLGDTRDALALKLHAYYADVADRSIITPGIAERAWLPPPGTPAGEALRFMMQFKAWGMAAVRQGFGRELYGGQGVAGAISGIVQMAIGSTLIGYTSMTLKDLFKGQTPRPPGDAKTWLAAIIQGGGFGIFGDYLFGEFSRFGGSLGETILGPVLGQGATEVINLWSHLKETAEEGDLKPAREIPAELTKIVVNNTPFINMFYTRMALNYLFLHSLQETMSPGYLRRMERRVQKQQGQSFWLSPSANHLQTFGR
jgi:hypothetical protein